MAASCTYHLPTIICLLLNKSHKKIKNKINCLNLNDFFVENFTGKKSGEWTISIKMTRQKEQDDQAEKQETRKEIGKGNQTTALRVCAS